MLHPVFRFTMVLSPAEPDAHGVRISYGDLMTALLLLALLVDDNPNRSPEQRELRRKHAIAIWTAAISD